MRIARLDGVCRGQTVYVAGTGPSLRCVPAGFLHALCETQPVIGLNQFYKYATPRWSITVHPELLAEYAAQTAAAPATARRTQWVVKQRPPRADLTLDDPDLFVFGTSYDVATVRTRPADVLHLGEGVQTTAMDLAARMGATAVVLIGCDAAALEGDFHGHDQHVRWLGFEPDQQYALYRRTTAAVRAVLREAGVAVLSLTPFIGATAAVEDYRRLKTELGLAPLPPPVDTSAYRRDPREAEVGRLLSEAKAKNKPKKKKGK